MSRFAEDESAGMVALAAFLDAYAPRWARVGRVTLHLAENKGDAGFPFAFMASYAAGLTSGGKIRRLPLGKALEEYAGARRKQELVKLLTPLHAAAKRSALIRDLVDHGDVFHPLVWTPDEAYAFLREIPLYEECGLLAQLPNWWRKRSRPQVSVSLDTGKGGAVGMDALLKFDISVALGDHRLDAREIASLIESGDRLVRLKGKWVEVDREKLRKALDHWKKVEREVGAGGVSFADGMRLLAGVPAGLGGPPPPGLRATLRGYQLAGVNWLWLCARLGVSAQSVMNWETKTGPLKLQSAKLPALQTLARAVEDRSTH